MRPAVRSRAGRLRCLISAYDARVLDEASDLLAATARSFGARTFGPIPLPVETSTLVVREAGVGVPYKLRLHRRAVDLIDPSSRLVDALVRFSLPAGVSISLKA